ncbi:hypothetical protein V144x_38610 [Gimesia aquarii]|uniref:Uncharacterized protein n=1 Tax=Gimesia aquarii TaxID=2527964 RepID=A0A517VZD7_9PLAN|nr:hypothetical protein V144x_38610 [Gimesia aquarii]
MKSLFSMFMIQSSKTRDFYSDEINRTRSIHREEKISTRARRRSQSFENGAMMSRRKVVTVLGREFHSGVPEIVNGIFWVKILNVVT